MTYFPVGRNSDVKLIDKIDVKCILLKFLGFPTQSAGRKLLECSYNVHITLPLRRYLHEYKDNLEEGHESHM